MTIIAYVEYLLSILYYCLGIRSLVLSKFPSIVRACLYGLLYSVKGLLNEPKYRHLRDLHKVIKQSELTLVSSYATLTSLGSNQEANVYRSKSGACVAFLSNYDAKYSVRVSFQNKPYDFPPWSINILPDCKTAVYNTARSCNEETPTVNDSDTLTTNGLWKQKNVTRDSLDYLWYMTEFLGPSTLSGLNEGSRDLAKQKWSDKVGLKGESLSLHTLSGSFSVEWVQGSLVAQKQPLTWYKVATGLDIQHKATAVNAIMLEHSTRRNVKLWTAFSKMVQVFYFECSSLIFAQTSDFLEVKADEMAICYILASMGNVLQDQYQSMTTAYNMLESLKEICGRNVNRQEVAQDQILGITLHQSSRGKVEQPAIVEDNVQGNVEEPVHCVVFKTWQMDVKTAFLNECLDECIYMAQPEGFMESGNERNNVSMLNSVKEWLSSHFDMKDLEVAAHILGIKLMRDRKQRILGLSQAFYITTILARFSMQNFQKRFLPFRHGITLSNNQSPKTSNEIERMKVVPYASAVGSLMYAMLCTRPDIYFAVGMVSRFQSNPGQKHWIAVKHIIKYLKRTRDYMLVFHSRDLIPIGHTDSDFQLDKDSRKSTSEYVFTLGGGVIVWKSIKQSCVADSTMKVEYVVSSKTPKEVVWLDNFLKELGVVLSVLISLPLYCDNSGATENSKEPRGNKRSKHIERKYHLIRDVTQRGDVRVLKIESKNSLVDTFTKGLTQKVFYKHVEEMSVKIVHSWL
ncbi:putative lysosomal alpha-glucosidase-like [Capsicum annuum]|nr:putative lysosomal alpha-glucosidase-like [Capsicum annuum]